MSRQNLDWCKTVSEKMKKIEDNYTVRGSLADETIDSWVWINDDRIPKGYISIKNKKNGNKIVVYKRDIDEHFIRLYNKPYEKIACDNCDNCCNGKKFYIAPEQERKEKRKYNDCEIKEYNICYEDIEKNKKKYIAINEYYRVELELKPNDEATLEIEDEICYIRYWWNTRKHPNPTVATANRISLFSLILGGISLFLGILSLVKCSENPINNTTITIIGTDNNSKSIIDTISTNNQTKNDTIKNKSINK
jgi:hypothetical protein